MNSNERTPPSPTQQVLPLELTPDEQAVLKECRTESFWQRSVPLMALSCAALHLAVKRGKVAPNAYLAKQFFVATSAFAGGKLSYVPVCKEKIFSRLPPDSNLVKAFKGEKIERPNIPPSTQGNQSPDYALQANQAQAPMAAPQSGGYDELRRRNREVSMGMDRKSQPVQDAQMQANDEPRMFDAKILPPAPAVKTAPSGETRKSRTNQYGDIIYEE